ncbi:BREX-1 system adenine-specific DNA-methyltransferase PglX [Dehalococcoidia bacterium]|nr:BREX-1 system adenine-specific DNA-methyltransferase PglX [Dehalococcoidia bacterium]
MKNTKEIVQTYKTAERYKTFPFAEWHRKDVFEKLIRDFLLTLGYNPDHINYDDTNGIAELKIHKDLKAVVYISSIQEEQRFLSNKISAPIDTIPDPETGKPEYEIAVVTNFEKWFFYFDGREIYAISGEKLEEEYNTIKSLISKDAIESGKFKEVARSLLHKEDNEPLRQELNILREKIAGKILQERTDVQYLKNPDGSYNNEILNEITTRWITRFLALKLAEDSGISFNFTLRDIRRSFELQGKTAKPLASAKVKEETLSNAIRALMNEFERRYNGGIFMYEEGVDYITIPDSTFFDLLDFTTGWAFTIEDARIIGFVYERFLGQEIVIEERKGRLSAVLKNIGEARGRRKAGGIYYTPKYIVDYIVENTLGEILKEKRKGIENAVKNIDCEKFISVLREVKSLKVLDPACGSGSFLIKVFAELKNFYDEVKDKAKEIRRKIDSLRRERIKGQMLFIEDKEILGLEEKYSDLQKEINEIKFSGTFALRNNIYGVDLDPKAIDITAFTLMVQVYDELKEDARCPTMIGENLKIGNSLVSAITPDEKEGFISRVKLERFKDEIDEIIRLREIEKSVDVIDELKLRDLIRENFEDVVDVYLRIKEKYPNAIHTSQQKLLDEWYKRAKKEQLEKTYDILINQTGLARIFLKEVYFEKIEKLKERIENEIDKPLIRYFNSQNKVSKDREFEEVLRDDKKAKEELRFIKDRAVEISKSQPPKAFNWEIEFPEVFFKERDFRDNIMWLINNVKKDNLKSCCKDKRYLPVGRINPEIINLISAKKDDLVYIKTEIYGKIRGFWHHWEGHPEIKDEHFITLPYFINQPVKVLKDERRENVYLFVAKFNHKAVIVIEIERNGERNEVNSIFFTRYGYLKNFKVIYETKMDSAGETAYPPILAHQQYAGVAGSRFSGLQAILSYYNKLSQKCQEKILKYFSLKENPGFDCVVGNPPHGAETGKAESFLLFFNPLGQKTNKDTGELFSTFSMHDWLKSEGFFRWYCLSP